VRGACVVCVCVVCVCVCGVVCVCECVVCVRGVCVCVVCVRVWCVWCGVVCACVVWCVVCVCISSIQINFLHNTAAVNWTELSAVKYLVCYLCIKQELFRIQNVNLGVPP
jgi:hypothetical protein